MSIHIYIYIYINFHGARMGRIVTTHPASSNAYTYRTR